MEKKVYNNGTINLSATEYVQQEKRYNLPIISLRIGKRHLLELEKILIGIETGLSTTVGSAQNKWQLSTCPLNYTGEIVRPVTYNNNVPIPLSLIESNIYEKELLEEISVFYLPLIVRVGYDLFPLEKFSFPVSLGVGGFFLNSTTKRTYRSIARSNVASIKTGEESNMSWQYNELGFANLVDLNLGCKYIFKDNLTFNLNINMIYTNKISFTTQRIDNWDSPQDMVGKESLEFGGLGYGVGLGASFKF